MAKKKNDNVDEFMSDFVNDQGAASAAPSILKIRKTAQEARRLEIQIAAIDATREELSKQLNAIKIGTLPAMMAQAGMPSFSLDDGTEIEIAEFCSGSLPKDEARRAKALTWLEKNEGASLIKTDISLAFGKTEGAKAKLVIAQLKKMGFVPTIVTGVNHMTLQAFARERLREGDKIDLDVLGLYAGKTAKFTLPGDKK